MSSIVTAVFKATIGLLVNKGRDKAAEKLKDGDVTDQNFRRLIVREIDDVKSKLDGLSRKDLLASISFFKEGIELLYEVFDRSENAAVATQEACAEAISLVKGMKTLELSDLGESARRVLLDAKERFKDARRKSTEAFNNEGLETADRILAMQYRVMATILETVDNPADAVAPCRVCLEELHSLSVIKECFDVELAKGLRARFGKEERRKIISNVCHVNFVIHGVTLMVCFGNKELPNLPCIGSGKDKVDPLRDERVTKVLRKQGMEHCCVTPWSFGQEGEEEHRLNVPSGIATDSNGHFIVGDYEDSNVKVFDSTGTFIKLFSLPVGDLDSKLYVLDVTTDANDKYYVLVRLKKSGTIRDERFVYELDSNSELYQKFPVRGERNITVTDNGKVMVLNRNVVNEYETDGQFVFSFGEGVLKDACDITAANDDRVMVVDWRDSCVHIFSEQGDHLNKFQLQKCFSRPRIAFHRASAHAVVADVEREKGLLHVKIYTKDGEFIRSTQIHKEKIDNLQGITVTTEGRIAVVCDFLYGALPAKVLVL